MHHFKNWKYRGMAVPCWTIFKCGWQSGYCYLSIT